MSRQDPLDEWTKELTKTFADLSKPQLRGLAEWSFGMILARCCSLDSVASHMGDWLEQPQLTVRSRLREWYLPAERKSTSVSGEKRTELPVHTCFAPLLRWLLRDWPVPRLALALDASTLGERFVLLAVSVLYRRCALPVAWKILPAIAKGAWTPHWLEWLQAMRGVRPVNWLVVAMTDRGLWAPWLVREIQLAGWHPLMRINAGGRFRPDGSRSFVPLKRMVPREGKSWCGAGTAFSTPGRQMDGTLLGWWGIGHEEPWLLLSDLWPQQGEARWYGMRSWIEQGFKDSKRGGWQWQHTRMEDPQRATRLWLAIAVATLWLLRVGGSAEAAAEAKPASGPFWRYEQMCRQCWGKSSVFARGLRGILIALLKHGRLPLGRWMPEPWPQLPLH
jgi:hypothetical protein